MTSTIAREAILKEISDKPRFFSELKRSVLLKNPEIPRTLVFETLTDLLDEDRVGFTLSGALVAK